MLDVCSAASLLAACMIVRLAYAGRSTLYGPLRVERLETTSASPLLRKPTMEAAYWVLAPFARMLVRSGVSANGVTAASLAFGSLAGLALAYGHFGVAGALATISALSDAVDGFVARETQTASEAGELFDATADRYNEFFFLAGASVLVHDSVPGLLLVLLTVHGSFMVSYATTKAEALRLDAPRGWMRRPERATYLTAGAVLSALAPVDSGIPGIPWPMVLSLLVVGVGSNVSAVRRLMHVARASTDRQRRAVVPGDHGPRAVATAIRSNA